MKRPFGRTSVTREPQPSLPKCSDWEGISTKDCTSPSSISKAKKRSFGTHSNSTRISSSRSNLGYFLRSKSSGHNSISVSKMEKCKETKRFRHHGCAHIELLDRLWKDSAKGKKRLSSKARAAWGVFYASFQMGPNSVPPTTSMDTGSRKRRSAGSGAVSHRLTGKAPVIDVKMTNGQMFEYWAEKQRRCQSSFTADVDVPLGDFVAALEAVEPKLSQEQFNRAYIQLGTNKYLRRSFLALPADRRRDFAWGCK
ncbi:hypothetical protein CJ030_MR3G028963 [Morella rubra]|uniref:Uncharacterized protein n=1 Tax=Morella rubra TaxID=262757 RepID=A0A6A1W661_9ROSI|nr:hypothetical protein CJ030_MR3G028963 [Morella rubra]